MNQLLYHYTTLEASQKIIKSKRLRVSQWEKKNKIKPPALWLSKNSIWEPTATKMIHCKLSDEVRGLTFDEQHELLGCARFTLSLHKRHLCSWAKYKHVSNTPSEIYSGMNRVGIEKGATPSDWFACFIDIPISAVSDFDIWDGRRWVSQNQALFDDTSYLDELVEVKSSVLQ